MSLLGEEIVEEWLNRKGYFTIRGVKLGVHEIDLLAIKVHDPTRIERRHIEVQVSVRPVSYICRVPKAVQKATGRAANSAKRNADELREGVKEWVQKKYDLPRKRSLMQELCSGDWTRELVVHNVKAKEELALIRSHGVKVHQLSSVVAELRDQPSMISAASGGDLMELVQLGAGI